MAQIQITRLVCDGTHAKETEATETINFGIGSQSYSLDLCTAHAKAFADDMKPWREAGRVSRGGTGRRPRGAGKARSTNSDSKAVRAFGRSTGADVKERGRINPAVIASWEKLSEKQREEWRARA